MNTIRSQHNLKKNQKNVSALSIDINSLKNIISKLFFFTSTLLVFSTAQIALSNSGVIVESGDAPYRVPLVNDSVKIDAVLNEDLWDNAVKIEPDIEVNPGENIHAPVDTEVLLAYSETHLYVAFTAYDPNPSEIRAHISDRDRVFGDDWVAIVLDTFNDQRRTYDFFSNPLGIQGDSIENSGRGDSSWDAIWASHGRITDFGYVVEMAIPFSSIPFQNIDGDQIWGFDAVRSYPRNVSHKIGSFPRDRNNNCYMCQSVKLVGFAEALAGQNIEIDPTFSSGTTQERANETSGPFRTKASSSNPGVTARWNFTPNMTLSATANPDFSQVEADVAQMDINSQFSLYYNEKRPFFLEGADVFSSQMRVVHTRTLADPDWGTKITGKEGRNTFGFFTARDKSTNLLLSGTEGSDNTSISMQNTGSVFRYKRDIGESSNIGVLMTDREADMYHNRLGGVDGTVTITPKDKLTFQLLGSKTQYPGQIVGEFEQPDGDFGGTAFDFEYMHFSKTFVWVARYRDISPDFRADLGFISQTGFRNSMAGIGYFWQKDPGHWYTKILVAAGGTSIVDYNNSPLSNGTFYQVEYNGPLQSYVNMNGNIGRSAYGGKEFDENTMSLYSRMNPTGSLFMSLSGNFGTRIDYAHARAGNRIRLNPDVEYKVGNRLTLGINHNFEQLNVDPGRLYTANVSNFKATYQFNRRTFLRTIIQSVNYDHNTLLYEDDDIDPENKSMFSQILFSYKINPQTMFFLGYSDNYCGDQDTVMTQTNRTIFTKIGYAFMM
ncbi:DUF5916 domain-containing protein [Candidatus Latescibacterota bacterium]